MGEDLPLDPNQVEPPQDGDATHIEVTSHEGDAQSSGENLGAIDHDDHDEEGRIEDKDKARDMAEAGDAYRTNAMENRNEETARKHENSFNGSTPEYRARFYDEQAERAEKTAGEIYDEAQSSDYSHDPEKAKQMILAERGRERNLAAPTPKEAGDKYDAERADDQAEKPRAEALKEAPDYKMSKIFLRYSHVIAENYRKHGDELTANLKALETAYNFMLRHGRNIAEYEFGKYVTVGVNTERDGAIDITTGGRNIGNTTEKWHIPMFDDDPKGYKYSGTYRYRQPRDFAYYEVTESAPDPDGEFDRVHTRKTRSLGDKDLANLDKLFGKVSARKTAQRENTLYPGDDGYAEELAEINYGRDRSLG